MTATDELRRLLDELGVEHTVIPEDMYGSREYIKVGNTEIRTNGLGEVAVFHLTPEQAVEATLGRGTCYDAAGKQMAFFSCSACGATTERKHPRFCFACGRKVVDA